MDSDRDSAFSRSFWGAQDIDNCCFVDRQCHSEQDWTAGYYAFRDNQCGAPGQTGAPAGAAPAQVDNCCFVDRQCSTDQEWTAGYYAFRDYQCGAPRQTGASAQPGGGVLLRTATGVVIGKPSGHGILPSTTPFKYVTTYGISTYDPNCCLSTWQCNSDQDWVAGYQAFQTNRHCALPGLVSIVGDPDFVTYYEQRLDQLRNRLPGHYTYVLDGLNKIQQSGPEERPHIDSYLGIYFVGWTGPSVDGWDTRESAVLVHEACHVHRTNAGHGRIKMCDHETFTREEIICREKELEVVIELDAPSHVIEWAHEMVARTRRGLTAPIPEGGC